MSLSDFIPSVPQHSNWFSKNSWSGACEVAKRIKWLAAKPEALGSVPATPMVERENQLPQVVL